MGLFNMINLFLTVLVTSMLSAQVYEGYMLYTPSGVNTTYYKDWNGNTINSWSHSNGPASMPYLFPSEEGGVENSLLYYPCRSNNPTMESGGVGGKIVIYNWDGDILYTYNVSSTNYQHHHDIAVLPNGNFIVVAWERLLASDWQELGRTSVGNNLNQIWSTIFIEVEPTLDGRTESYDDGDDSEVVWVWRIADHLVQDISPNYSSTYGEISDHPELFNVNEGSVGGGNGPNGGNADWIHVNALDYNADLDQLAFSSRFMDEIYIIDHSTTTEEAASHSGGNSGKGGDFLYRWGQPSNYDRGNNADNILEDQHSVNWIPEGYPGAGNLILFNNFHSGNNAAVLEIETPLQPDGSYSMTDNEPYGPETYSWIYGPSSSISTQMQGGAFRLPNGNTFITDCDDAKIVEVRPTGQVVYSYEYPSNNSTIARASKYAPEFFDPAYSLGDINDDGELNILDVVSLVNIILSLDNSNPAADMNEDGLINVLDVILLINTIIGVDG